MTTPLAQVLNPHHLFADANGALAGRSLYLTRDENGRYACSSDLDQAKYLPSNCY